MLERRRRISASMPDLFILLRGDKGVSQEQGRDIQQTKRTNSPALILRGAQTVRELENAVTGLPI